MEPNRDFNLLKTPELQVVRHGFFKTTYEIFDGQFCYGVINYAGRFDGYSTLITTKDTLTIKRQGTFDGTLLIYNALDENIASITIDRSIHFSGINAHFSRTGFFTNNNSWKNETYGTIFTIKESGWSYKKPFAIKIEMDALKNVPEMPLLILLATNLTAMLQRRSY